MKVSSVGDSAFGVFVGEFEVDDGRGGRWATIDGGPVWLVGRATRGQVWGGYWCGKSKWVSCRTVETPGA